MGAAVKRDSASMRVTVVVAQTLEWSYLGIVFALIPSSEHPWQLAFLGLLTLSFNVVLSRLHWSMRRTSKYRVGVNTLVLGLCLNSYGAGGFGWALGFPMVVGVSALTPSNWGVARPDTWGYGLSFLISTVLFGSQLALKVSVEHAFVGLGCCIFVGIVSVRLAGAFRKESESLASQVQIVYETQTAMEKQSRLSVAGLMAANIAHEINNPLTYAMLNLDLLQDHLGAVSSSDSEVEDYVRQVDEALVQITEVIRDFRGTIAKGSDQSSEILDLSVVVAEALRVVRYSHPLIRIEADIAIGLMVRVRHHRLLQVLLNLLFNAVDAVQRSEIAVEGDQIWLVTRLEGDTVCVDVQDTGGGVAASMREEIFAPFYSSKAGSGGMGLGLAIARSLAQSEEGTLLCLDGGGKGALFRLTLPVVISAQKAQQVLSRSAGVVRNVPLEVQRILVIDDQSNIRKSVSRMLSPRQVVLADSGQEALRLCANHQIDFVICDVWMPGMTGLEVYESLRIQNPDLLDRFLFITGGVLAQDLEEFMERNTAPYLLKPFRKQELLDCIDRYMALEQPQSQDLPNSGSSLV